MKKASLLFSLALILIFTSAFSLKEWQTSLYETIKTETIKGIKANFKTDISIGKAEGLVVGQVVFKNVVIPGFAQAKKVYVNYSPVKFAYHKDVVPAISKITIVDGEFKITRDKRNQFNVFSLLPPEDPNAPPPPPFRAKLIFKNCSVDYVDQLGFRSKAKAFNGKASKLKGKISFQREDEISIKLNGEIQNAPAKLSALFDFKRGGYKVNLAAKKVDLKKWGNYAVPLDELIFKDGLADISLEITPPKLEGWVASLSGIYSFDQASAQFGDYKIENTSGKLSMEDDQLVLENIKTHINNLPLTVEGQFSDFAKQNLGLRVALNNINLNQAVSFFPQTEKLDLKGSGEAFVKIRGSVASPSITGTAKVNKGTFYNQAFTGSLDLYYKQSLLKIDILGLNLYKGKVRGTCEIDFSKKIPALSLNAHLSRINLAALSQNSPGVVGRASGKLNLSGPLSGLVGNLSANLDRAMLLGQPIDKLSSAFHIEEGEIHLKSFSASSKTASLFSSGKISRDLNFYFQAQAQGIKLSGSGPFGKMEALVDSFKGDVSWKLDKEFFASPLKNLAASGEAILSQGKIGEQLFDSAQGRLNMGAGLIHIDHVTLRQNQSLLVASGQTGIGSPTYLEITGENISLEDLKILNHILPEEAKDPTGQASLSFVITGQFTSPDSLLDLNAKGHTRLENVVLAGIPINSGIVNFAWQDRTLNLSNCKLELPESEYLSLDLKLGKNNQIKGKVEGIITLSQIERLTIKYGKLAGKLGANIVLEGPIENPGLAASFWLEDFHFNKINFDKIKGGFTYSQNRLILTRPAVFSKKSSKYELSGIANLAGFANNKPEENNLNLKLKIIKADLGTTLDLSDKIRAEVARKVQTGPADQKLKINLSTLVLPTVHQYMDQDKIKFYARNGKRKYFFQSWDIMLQELKQDIADTPEKYLGGSLSGDISIYGQIKNLAGKFRGEIKKGSFRDYEYENLKAEGILHNNRFQLKAAELSKQGGKLSVKGDVELNGNLSLDLVAKNLPMDILKIAFSDEFQGRLNMQSSLKGTLQNPEFSAAGDGKDVDLAGVHFDKISFSLAKGENDIVIEDFSLTEDRNLSSISGSLSLTTPGSINLRAQLKDNAIGLFNLLTKETRWIKGKGSAIAKISGSLENANINGEVKLKDSTLYVKAINSEIKEVTGQAKITDSQAKITGLTGFWQGQSSKQYLNPLGLAGTINLNKIFSINKMIDLDLVFTPTHLYVDLPNLYTGTLKIKQANLVGPFHFDLSRGPTISGEAEINNAVITLSRRSAKRDKVFPLNFDLLLSLKKNAYATMGDVATLDLSNIFMNLEINSDKLKVAGSLASPSLLGKIFLKRGTVTIFNREFTLLSVESQENYFPYNQEKIKENIALFTGEEGVLPQVTITARVEVENQEEDPSGESITTRAIILSHLQGIMGATEKERALKVTFDSFTEDKTKIPSEFVPTNYSEETIKVMLLPDFIKSLTGISQGQDSQVDTNVVVADYLSSRLQTWAFRAVEREVEQRLGLESLTLEYNFGKEVRQGMGIEEERTVEGEKPDLRVGFVKALSDRLFVDFKYSQYAQNVSETGRPEIFNYQLTYKLSPIWSIIYYREPISLRELTSGYEKVTLKAGLSLW